MVCGMWQQLELAFKMKSIFRDPHRIWYFGNFNVGFELMDCKWQLSIYFDCFLEHFFLIFMKFADQFLIAQWPALITTSFYLMFIRKMVLSCLEQICLIRLHFRRCLFNHQDGRSISRNIASLTIFAHGVINLL